MTDNKKAMVIISGLNQGTDTMQDCTQQQAAPPKKHESPLKAWLATSIKHERLHLAARAGTTEAYLYQLGGGHSRPSSELAQRLEDASHAVTPDRPLKKEELIFGAPPAGDDPAAPRRRRPVLSLKKPPAVADTKT